MRISADSKDPDYFGDDSFGRYVIKLDGVPQHRVLWADDVAGELGIVNLERSRATGETAIDLKRGRVEIIDGRARLDLPTASALNAAGWILIDEASDFMAAPPITLEMIEDAPLPKLGKRPKD